METRLKPLKEWWGDRPSRSEVAPGLTLPQYQAMDLDGAVGSTLDNEQALSQAIRVVLLTRLYQVPQKLGFGSRLSEYLDKPTSATGGLTREVQESLATWEKRIKVRRVQVEPVPSTGSLILRVVWSPSLSGTSPNFETSVILDV